MRKNYVIGLDFGTDSVRVLLVDARTGETVGTAVAAFPRWREGLYCDPAASQYRQHPMDYLEAMEACLMEVLRDIPAEVRNGIAGISVDATGSTPVPVNREGVPLALLPEFSDNPNAMFILWKDHTANAEAAAINERSRQWVTDFTGYSGGIYSSEWFWSKIWHVLQTDQAVAAGAYSWVEQCDWLPAVLTGHTDPLAIRRSRCAAGHKAMWHEHFDGLPSASFLRQLDPRLADLRERLYRETYTADQAAGNLSRAWADKLGLAEDIVIGVGAIDAHMGAVGACITPYSLVKVMGTSTCDMLVAPPGQHGEQLVKGICGQVDGSILPGMIGFEAGQSAFGDVYQWFAGLLAFPLQTVYADRIRPDEQTAIAGRLLDELNRQAAALPLRADDEIAVDWINGRRTPDADLTLTGAIAGLHLGSNPARIFKALVEATAFGSKAIIARFEQEGIPVHDVIALGGISKKSPFVMQTLANILNRPVKTVQSEQACALGAAMFAAVVSGLYPDIRQAQSAMSSGFETTYYPDAARTGIYEQLYQQYRALGAVMPAKIV